MRPMLYERFDADGSTMFLTRHKDCPKDKADLLWALHEKATELIVDRAVVLDAQNIEDFLASDWPGLVERKWALHHNDGLVMPWPVTWLEYEARHMESDNRHRALMRAPEGRDWTRWRQAARLDIGTLVVNQDLSEDPTILLDIWDNPERPAVPKAVGGEPRWLQSVTVYVRVDGTMMVGPMGAALFVLDENGRRMVTDRVADGNPDNPYMASNIMCPWVPDPKGRDLDIHTWYEAALFHGVVVAEFAARFANCKNVMAVEDSLPRQAARAYERKTGEPAVKHKVLVIDPTKTPGSRAAGGEKRPVPLGVLPRHIVRGHFSYYGDAYGRGRLFGKLEGRYWIPAHARGNKARGVIEKEYREAPVASVAEALA